VLFAFSLQIRKINNYQCNKKKYNKLIRQAKTKYGSLELHILKITAYLNETHFVLVVQLRGFYRILKK
jgi:hypothetical protein